MRAFVLTDEALSRQAGRFVWLSIDTERAENEAFLARFPVDSWPTLWVIDPGDETTLLRWTGAPTVLELNDLLDDASGAMAGGEGGLDRRRALADRANGQRRFDQAAELYQRLLNEAPRSWPRYGRTVEALLSALQQGHRLARCAFVALDQVPKLKGSSSYAAAADTGLDCALDAQASEPWRKTAIASLQSAVACAIDDRSIAMNADDRSGLYQSLIRAYRDASDQAGATRVAQDWAAFLERQAAGASSAEARAVFDAHRLAAYTALGQLDKAVPMLEASERDLPADYNPPARLAIALRGLGRYDEALSASDRALKLAYGPRRVRLLKEKATTLRAKGDLPAARAVLQQALDLARSSLPGSIRPEAIESLEKEIQASPAPPEHPSSGAQSEPSSVPTR